MLKHKFKSWRGFFTTIASGFLMMLAACRPGDKSEMPTPSSQPSGGPVVVVTGANRGIGLEFTRQLQASGATVIATARKPEKARDLHKLGVEVIKLDVTVPEDIIGLVDVIGDRHIDMLINNAGIMGKGGEQIGKMNFDRVEQLLAVNTIGPMRVTQALLPALMRGQTRRIINISSVLGSIERNGGGYYGYRESKAALNRFTKTISNELRSENFTCIALSPGWVRTDLGGSGADLSPEESITGMLKVFDTLTPEVSGSFYHYDGSSIDW